jgi:hypothetical protein
MASITRTGKYSDRGRGYKGKVKRCVSGRGSRAFHGNFPAFGAAIGGGAEVVAAVFAEAGLDGKSAARPSDQRAEPKGQGQKGEDEWEIAETDFGYG